jgi:hypothetical protein
MKAASPSKPQRVVWRVIYYFAILVAVIALHGRGSFTPAPFVYLGF